MNWKTRQLFSDREHGIVSGLSPINMVNGGSVPIPGYQTGGLALDLFEEGDQEINEPLNMMAQAVSPSLDVGPTAPTEIGEAVGEETALMDQGFGEYQVELQSLKETFKDEIRSYVAQAGTTDLEKYLQRMDVVYNNQLNKLKNKHGITEALPEDLLLTEDFIAELIGPSEAEIPGFENGGKVTLTQPQLDELFGSKRMSLEVWNGYNEREQNILLMKAQIAKIEQDRTSAPGLDMTELNRLIKERRGLAGEIGEAARSGYSSVQDPVSHFFSARKAGKTAELGAREKMIADEIALQQALLTSQSRSGGVGGLDFDFSAKESEALTLGDIQIEKEERERIDKAWSDFTKPKPGDVDFDFGEALYYFLQQTNGVFPSQYKTELRIFKNPVDGEDWSGALPEYYDLVIKASRNPENLDKTVDPRRAQEKYIQNQLNKWHSFQRK